MSILPPEIYAALTQLLQALSSSDNNLRAQAEEQLNTEWVAARPDFLLMGLVEQLQDAVDPSVSRKHACLLSPKNCIADKGPWGFSIDAVFCSGTLPTHSKQDKEAVE